LVGERKKRLSFKKYLLAMPDAGADEIFERKMDFGRKIEL
jgi:hypothetical protein